MGSLDLLKRLNYPKDQIAIVGDRYCTDVLYAINGGMKSILVKDIITEEGDEYWAVKVHYKI